MRRAVLLMTLLTRAAAPNISTTESPSTSEPRVTCNSCTSPTSTMVVPASPTNRGQMKLVTSKPRRKLTKHGKAESPMLNYIFDSYATSNKHFHDNFRAPSFEDDLNTDDTIMDADTGETVFFDCRVSSLRDKMVSWLRVSENEHLELLTLNLETYTADSRYRIDLAGDNWRLELADTKLQDSGIYCCHVSTHPPMLRRVKLTVHPPEMKMSEEAFLETGETLSLKCAVLHLHPGDTVPWMHWFRENSSVPLDEVRGGVLIETDHLTMTSHLQVSRLKMEDAGNYTCVLQTPIAMKATTRVHVLQGSSLAELQSGVISFSVNSRLLIISICLIVAEIFRYLLEPSVR